MQYRQLVVLIFLIFLISCGGKQHITHEVRKPDGAPYPDPYFSIQTLEGAGIPLRLSFYYEVVDYKLDLDKSLIGVTSFIDPRGHQFIDEGENVRLIVRILNPTNGHYKVYLTQKIDFSLGGDLQSYHLIGQSDMKYREFVRQLPTWKGIENVSFLLQIMNKDESPLVSTRGIKYSIN